MPNDNIDMLSVIEGKPRKYVRCWPNTEKHLARLRQSFCGKKEACFQLVKQIVYLRRKIDSENSWIMFNTLLYEYIDLYVDSLDTRWLVSICDTFADYGSPVERSNALLISTLVNMIKILETVRLVSMDPGINSQKVMAQKRQPLWDGMSTFSIKTGNMPRNLFARIDVALKETVILEEIWQSIYARLQKEETILKQLHALHQGAGFFHKLD